MSEEKIIKVIHEGSVRHQGLEPVAYELRRLARNQDEAKNIKCVNAILWAVIAGMGAYMIMLITELNKVAR